MEELNLAKGDVEEFANAAKPVALNADADVWDSSGEVSFFVELSDGSTNGFRACDVNGEIIEVLWKPRGDLYAVLVAGKLAKGLR